MSEKLLQAWEAVKAVNEGKEVEWRWADRKFWSAFDRDSSAKCLENNILFRLKPKPRRVKLDGVGSIAKSGSLFILNAMSFPVRGLDSGFVSIDARSIQAKELAALLAERIANGARDNSSFSVNPDGKTATCTFTVELEPEE